MKQNVSTEKKNDPRKSSTYLGSHNGSNLLQRVLFEQTKKKFSNNNNWENQNKWCYLRLLFQYMFALFGINQKLQQLRSNSYKKNLKIEAFNIEAQRTFIVWARYLECDTHLPFLPYPRINCYHYFDTTTTVFSQFTVLVDLGSLCLY